MSYSFHIGAYSDIGPRKQSNQDSCCALISRYTTNDDPGDSKSTALLAVCDGVGGLESGEVASASIVHWLVDWFENDYPLLLNEHIDSVEALFDAVEFALKASLSALNAALGAQGNIKGIRMGTTFTAILLVEDAFIIGHIGDTRVYRFRDGGMEILTNDQTWVAQEVARGNIPPEKARNHPKRNIILQSVGTQAELVPEFSQGSYRRGDVYLVCCDGFRNELFDDELIETFGSLIQASDGEIENACARLTKLSLSRGELDNITAVAAVCCEDADYGGDSADVTTSFAAIEVGE